MIVRGASDVARRRSRSSQRGYGGPKGGGVSPPVSPLGRIGVHPAAAIGAVDPPAAAACLARSSRPRRSASFLLAPLLGSPSSGLPVRLVRDGLKFFEKDGVWYAIIRMRPAKKAGATKTLPLVLGGGGTLLDPVAALKHLFDIDPVPEEQMATTPLFRHGGAAFTVEGVRANMVKASRR